MYKKLFSTVPYPMNKHFIHSISMTMCFMYNSRDMTFKLQFTIDWLNLIMHSIRNRKYVGSL